MRYLRPVSSILLLSASTVSGLQQSPLRSPAMPNEPEQSTNVDHNIFLSDILSSDKSINIFAGFTRDFAQLSRRFEDGTRNTTILAPMNSAIMKLPRKPWEDRDLEGGGVNADGGDENEKAKENMRKFVEAHVVPTSPWQKGDEGKTEALGGGAVWWEEKDGKRFVQPGDIEVSLVANTVHNGEVWVLKGVRNYA